MSLTLTISSTDLTDRLIRESLSISAKLSDRSTMSFDLYSAGAINYLVDGDGNYIVTDDGYLLSTTFEPLERDEITLVDGSDILFSGTIDSVEKTPIDGNIGYCIWHIECVDWNQLADRFIVYGAYDNQLAGDIVKDLLDSFLGSEGIGQTDIQDGPEIEKIIFNYISLHDALDRIAEIIGYYWNIDYEKGMCFFPSSSNAAPFNLNETSLNFRNPMYKRTREKYRNRQYIRAGTGTTDSQVESFKGDGAQRTFTVGYPIDSQPTITVNAVAKTVGIKGVETGFDYYWNRGERQVTQDTSGTLLTSSDTLAVTYVGQIPILVVADDNDEIANVMTVESGSGLYEVIDDAPELNTRQQATDRANSYLNRFSTIPGELRYETDTSINSAVLGLNVGMFQTVDLPEIGIIGSYLIDSFTIRLVDQDRLQYTINALDGNSIGGWEDFFKSLVRRDELVTSRENEVVIYLRRQNDVVNVIDTITATQYTPESRAGYAIVNISEAG